MQGLRTSEHTRQRLDRHAGDVVQRLLCSQGNTGCLRVEAQQPGALVLRSEAVLHQAIPDLARGTIFRDLLEEIVMCVEEEAEARPEFVDIQSTAPRPL